MKRIGIESFCEGRKGRARDANDVDSGAHRAYFLDDFLAGFDLVPDDGTRAGLGFDGTGGEAWRGREFDPEGDEAEGEENEDSGNKSLSYGTSKQQ